jgi:hypothetical protein
VLISGKFSVSDFQFWQLPDFGNFGDFFTRALSSLALYRILFAFVKKKMASCLKKISRARVEQGVMPAVKRLGIPLPRAAGRDPRQARCWLGGVGGRAQQAERP